MDWWLPFVVMDPKISLGDKMNMMNVAEIARQGSNQEIVVYQDGYSNPETPLSFDEQLHLGLAQTEQSVETIIKQGEVQRELMTQEALLARESSEQAMKYIREAHAAGYRSFQLPDGSGATFFGDE